VNDYVFADDETTDPTELLELMHAVGRASIDERVFDWWFERNPAGPRLISVARSNGRAVGMAAMSPFVMQIRGERHVVQTPVHVATHPEHRRRGIFSALELRNEQRAAEAGAPLTLTFPNAASNPIFLRRLGWQKLRPRRLWARPLGTGAIVRYLTRGDDGAGGLKPASFEPRSDGPFVIRPLDRFGAEVDELARRAAQAYGNHVVRDARFLAWRYLDSPQDYRCFGAFRGRELEGLAVVGHAIKRGVSAGFVADLLTAAAAHEARVALLRRSRDELASGTSALIALPPRGQALAFVRVGFMPTHERIRFVAKPLRPGVRLDADPAAWHLTLGDFDFF
jgi:GNAT superfamily N-acetyltransferase